MPKRTKYSAISSRAIVKVKAHNKITVCFKGFYFFARQNFVILIINFENDSYKLNLDIRLSGCTIVENG